MGLLAKANTIHYSVIPALILLFTLIGSFISLIAYTVRKRDLTKLRNWAVVTTSITAFILTLMMYPLIVIKGWSLEFIFPKYIMGTGLRLLVDPLGLFFALLTSFLWTVVNIYAVKYMEHELKRKGDRWFTFSMFSLVANMGVLLAGADLLTIFVFYEALGVFGYALVIHEERDKSFWSGSKYLIMTMSSGLVLLTGIFLLWYYTGTYDLTLAMATFKGSITIKWAIAILLIAGFGVKAGLVPVHSWLRDAHGVAPIPSHTLLSSLIIKVGSYGIFRVLYFIYGVKLVSQIGLGQVMLFLGLFGMIMGSVWALNQIEIKKLLAYSSIAQVGYILTGFALLTPKTMAIGIMHIVSHAIMKGTLFLGIGAVIHQAGFHFVDELRGVGKKMPLTMIAITIGASSMIGIPLTIGFLTKWYLGTGAFEAVKLGIISYPWAVAVVVALITSGMLNLVYYGPIVLRGWMKEPIMAGGSEDAHADDAHGHSEEAIDTEEILGGGPRGHWDDGHNRKGLTYSDPHPTILVPVLLLAFLTVFFGLFPQFPWNLAQFIAKAYFGG